MLYVPFPSLDAEEQLEGLTPIAWEHVEHGPYANAAADERFQQIVLEMRGDRPIWHISPWDAEPYALWADTGMPSGSADEAEAELIASRFGDEDIAAIRQIYNDQWSVPDSYDAHRPLWKVELEGSAGTVLYVSSVTGSVVLDTNATERFWNWLGSIPHWLYPRILREEQSVWRQVVMWVSGPCIIVTITGIWIGLMRLKMGQRRFSKGRMTPYHGWMKWHHVSGLIGSAFLLLWIFSGWLSVDPFRLFASDGISPEVTRAYMGDDPLPDPDLALLQQAAPQAHRISFTSAAGQFLVRAQTPAQDDIVLAGNTLEPFSAAPDRIEEAAALLVPAANITSVETLTAPDAYWYAVRGEVPLPVLRFRYDDRPKTWVYIDPATGELLSQTDSRRRTYRWLFDLFHRWDLNLLINASPARDLLIWLMSIIGLISSATAVYLGWKRLRRPYAGGPSAQDE